MTSSVQGNSIIKLTVSRKKILFIIPSLEEGGAERVLVNLLKRLDYSLFEVDLCVVENRGIYFKDIPEQVNVITIFNSSLWCRVFSNVHIRFNINGFYRLIVNRKIKKHYNTGISFLDSSFTDILFFLDEKVEKKIAWVHSSYQTYRNFKKFFTDKYTKRVINHRYKRLDHIVFVSEDSRAEFRQIFGEFSSMQVIYNMIDAADVLKKSGERIDERFDSELINIVALGVLLPVKAYDKLIEAAALLKKDGLGFKIRILGNGFMEPQLRQMIQKLNVADVVELMGFRSNPYPFLKASQVFVMTSVSEGLPTALCEAMILGLPAVVTDSSGCRELVGYGEFGMMTEQTVEGIYNGLKTLILSKEKREYFCLKSLQRAEIFNDSKVLNMITRLIN